MKKSGKWLSCALAALLSLCVFAGCAADKGEADGASAGKDLTTSTQEAEQQSGQAGTAEHTPCPLPDTGLPNYIPARAEWQEIASDGGYFVTVDERYLDEGDDLVVEVPFQVLRVAKVEGCEIPDVRDENGKLMQLALFVMETREKGEEVLNTLRSLEGIDYAWENTYDYRAVYYSAEPKEAWLCGDLQQFLFLSRFTLKIDAAFEGRIFTCLDFPFSCMYAVQWQSYEQFRDDPESLERQVFYVRIWERDKQSMLRYQRVLSELAFVHMCSPDLI